MNHYPKNERKQKVYKTSKGISKHKILLTKLHTAKHKTYNNLYIQLKTKQEEEGIL